MIAECLLPIQETSCFGQYSVANTVFSCREIFLVFIDMEEEEEEKKKQLFFI